MDALPQALPTWRRGRPRTLIPNLTQTQGSVAGWIVVAVYFSSICDFSNNKLPSSKPTLDPLYIFMVTFASPKAAPFAP